MNTGITDQQAITYILMANTLGHSVIMEVFNSAVSYFAYSAGFINGHSRMTRRMVLEGSACYAFVQGTGLDLFLNRYSMDYDADRLREGFTWCLKKSFPVLT